MTHLISTLRAEWSRSSIVAKSVIVIIPLIVIAIVIMGSVGLSNYFHNRSYEKREAERVAERAQDEAEKAQLRIEKQKALTEAAEAQAQKEIYKQVAESKRSDRAQTVKELEAIEIEHAQHKAEAEATGNSLSDRELADELCKRLAARGYPPCPR